ncbi:MAG: ornithine carbamoyltransferase [Lentisphaerae bacterium]|jgi:ornithine carbamoyltransferase|nr:ornithine carbamoyltransferase [Lentisphaerota bacterium]
MKLEWSLALKNRSLLTLDDLSDSEMLEIVKLAMDLKSRRDSGVRGDLLERRQIALIFEKSSTRTRCAAACAVREEGGNAEYLTRNDIHLGGKESAADTARVLGRMFDGILFRGFSQHTVETLAAYAGVPVWNGLTDVAHPTQILADLMTVKQVFGAFKGLKLAYVGDGRNNVATSLMMGCAKAGVDFVNCTPPELAPDATLTASATAVAATNGSTVSVVSDPKAGVKGANIIYTDVWVSMGEENEKSKRLSLLQPYQVNSELVAATGVPQDEFIFLHCLPAFHNHDTDITRLCGALEVTDEVFEAPYSKVFDEAENRMHTIKALFVSALA